MSIQEQPVLEARNVHTTFVHEGKETEALRDLSLSVGRGEFVTVVGPSGCGKSTLLRLFGGFLLPDLGRVLFRGDRVTAPAPDRVMMFQEFDQLFPWKTVAKNVEFPLKAGKKNRTSERNELGISERRKKAQEMLAEVGLEGFEETYPHRLSGGMKQRAALARTLVGDPELVLMDEPFGSVDALKREVLQDLLLSIRRRRPFTAVFVTHDIREAVYLGDRVIVMGEAAEPLRSVVEVDAQRPRSRESEELEEMARRIRELFEPHTLSPSTGDAPYTG